ncbi:MAG TPA: polysaccharide biosynthesis C-terminal domain-containing protein, partial [Candidatus Limnocylindrales bacterium]|nr:polysaccharide biosynthesis C-terminal domain-containing protein [Candidatus Limnocylindrales bacterium]
VNILNSIFICLRAAMLVAVLSLGYGLEGIGVVEFIVEVLNLFSKYIACKKADNKSNYNFQKASIKSSKKLISFAFLTFVALLGDALRWNTDSIIIGRMLSMDAVGVYGVGAILVKLFLRISSAVSITTYPGLSGLAATNIEEFKKMYMSYSQITALVVAGIAIQIIIFSESFISLWVGIGYDDSSLIAIILTISLSLDYITSVAVNGLKALNKQKIFALQTLFEGFANLILSILLIPHFGIIGVAVGTAIPMIITKVIIQPIYSSKIIGINYSEYFIKVLVQPILFGAAIYFLATAIGLYDNIGNYISLFFMCSFVGTIYFMIIIIFITPIRNQCIQRSFEVKRFFGTLLSTVLK